MVKFTPPTFCIFLVLSVLRAANGNAYGSSTSTESAPADLVSDCKSGWFPISVDGLKGAYCTKGPVCTGFEWGKCPPEGECVIVAKESGVYGCVKKGSPLALAAKESSPAKCGVAHDTPTPTPARTVPTTEAGSVPNQVTEELPFTPVENPDTPPFTFTPLDTKVTDVPSTPKPTTPAPTTLKPSASPQPTRDTPASTSTPASTTTAAPTTTPTTAPTMHKPVQPPGLVYNPEPTAAPAPVTTAPPTPTKKPEDSKATPSPTPCKTKADGTPESGDASPPATPEPPVTVSPPVPAEPPVTTAPPVTMVPTPVTTEPPVTVSPTPTMTAPTPTTTEPPVTTAPTSTPTPEPTTAVPTTATTTPAPTSPIPTPAPTPCKSTLGNPVHDSVDQTHAPTPTTAGPYPTPIPTTATPTPTASPADVSLLGESDLMEEYYGTVAPTDDAHSLEDLRHRRSLRHA